jgi:hypothetical protein
MGERVMTTGFQQQQAPAHNAFTRSAPAPQHGQKSAEAAKAVKTDRAFEPRPGH